MRRSIVFEIISRDSGEPGGLRGNVRQQKVVNDTQRMIQARCYRPELGKALPTLPANVHLALPCHNLYRPLAYSSFGGRKLTPSFPAREDLQPVLDAGRKILAGLTL